MMRGHRTSIIGPGIVRNHGVQHRPTLNVPPSLPQWSDGSYDPNIKRRWLMYIEDERQSDWKLPNVNT